MSMKRNISPKQQMAAYGNNLFWELSDWSDTFKCPSESEYQLNYEKWIKLQRILDQKIDIDVKPYDINRVDKFFKMLENRYER